jgi:very-short-patch-repair endonuclease
VEEAIMSLAAGQHGVVTRAQLVDAGFSADVVDHRLKRKRLRPLHRGVYLVGPLVARRVQEMAAVLACGRGAAISHRSAAMLWQLLPESAIRGPVEVSSERGDHTRRPGIRMHRVRTLPPDEVTMLDGIPVTTVLRTLCDLAGAVDRRELERALAEALTRRLASRSGILLHLACRSPARGLGALRALVEMDAHPALTRSEAEERFLALVRRARLPHPVVNVTVGGYEIDFLWDPGRLVVEVDGFAYHSSARMFERDRRRDADLTAAGLRVMRVTWRQIVSEPEALVVRLAQALAQTGVR